MRESDHGAKTLMSMSITPLVRFSHLAATGRMRVLRLMVCNPAYAAAPFRRVFFTVTHHTYLSFRCASFGVSPPRFSLMTNLERLEWFSGGTGGKINCLPLRFATTALIFCC